MAELSEDQKREIVDMLACFRDPKAIVDHFGENYGLDIPYRQVLAYDPSRPHYDSGDKWRDIFDARRKAYLEEVATVPIANQGFRLNILNEQLRKALAKGDRGGEVLMILEQAAKEVGGILTNQRELRVDDNRRPPPSAMSPEDRKAMLAEIIRTALEQRPPPPPAPPALQ